MKTLATALALAAQGAHAAIAARRRDRLEKVHAHIRDAGVHPLVIESDLMQRATELQSHNRPKIIDALRARAGSHIIRPTQQEG